MRNNEKIWRVGVIGRTGKGDYGHGLDTVWMDVPRAEIVAVADDNPQGLQAARQRLKVDAGFADYREMLDKAKPEIVAICPRWIDRHFEMATEAARRGIHIFMEKPFVRSLEEADQLIRECEQTHTRLALAHPTHYSPKLKTIKKLIAEGQLGQVLEYRLRGKEDARGGALDLWVLGSHMLDLLRELGGHPQWCFAEVRQNGKSITPADVREGAEGIGPLAGNSIQAMFRMPDGSTAYWASEKNAMGNPRRYGMQIFGSKGILEIYEGVMPEVNFLPDSSWSPARSGAQWLPVSTVGIDQPETLKDERYTSGSQTAAVLDLIDAIENQRDPLCGMYDGRGVVELTAGVFESQRIGGPVAFPLKNRRNPLALLGQRTS